MDKPINGMMLGKSRNILITGLGYIGYEICKTLRLTDDYVMVMDKNFYPDRVAKISKWGMIFKQLDLFDECVPEFVSEFDIIIHTAGITDVPRVIGNDESDALIRRYGEEATKILIDNTRDDALFVFLSTHVVFEGDQSQGVFAESSTPLPILAYAKTKVASENYLFSNRSNYKIFRLASVYGYNRFMRMNIMPNIFARLASQGNNINVFGNGQNIKPLIHIKDVAEGIIALMDEGKNKIIHLVTENLTVENVAKICQSTDANIKIKYTDDPIPNKGYLFVSNEYNFNHRFASNEIPKIINKWKLR